LRLIETGMFERTRSIWKRLVHSGTRLHASRGTALAEEDRRVCVRYPVDLPTTLQPSAGAKSTTLPARIRDLSLGGVNLEVERSFAPGALLSVELPGADEQSTIQVLACVVHARELDNGKWSLGCTFSRELSAEDLAAFGAARQEAAEPDQRNWQRFPCQVKATYQLVGSDSSAPLLAEVLDISPSGVGLLVRDYVDNGTLLSVELKAARSGAQRTMLACVVHVSARSPNHWALGCNFIRSLSEDDLRALL
jgi:c-di-GMP-binding flagellar brake protein YcgR